MREPITGCPGTVDAHISNHIRPNAPRACERVVVENDGALERLCQFIFHLAPDVVTRLSVTLKI